MVPLMPSHPDAAATRVAQEAAKANRDALEEQISALEKATVSTYFYLLFYLSFYYLSISFLPFLGKKITFSRPDEPDLSREGQSGGSATLPKRSSAA